MLETRIFTVEEAEQTLPLVERIVRDLQGEYASWRQAVGHYEVLSGGARAEWGETPELVAAREAITRLAERINGYLSELSRDRLRAQGIRHRPGGFLFVAGGPTGLPLLAAG